jgi:hypothetical protein
MRDREVSIEQLGAAFVSFGRDARSRLSWLLGFVERDVSSREAADQAALEAMIFTFAARLAGPPGSREVARMGALEAETLSPSAIRAVHRRVGDAQRTAREVLTSFATGGGCRFTLEVVGWDRLADGRVLPRIGGDWWARFLGAVSMLLVEAGEEVRVCANEDCQRLFVRSKRQEYCDARCSQRRRTQRFRAANPERVRELRHQSHARRQRRAPGRQNVKVERRARGQHKSRS